MKRTIFKRLLAVVMLACALCVLTACSRLASIKLPPLPTPSEKEADSGENAFAQDPRAALSEAQIPMTAEEV